MSRNLAAAAVCLALILAITFLSASGIGFEKDVQTMPWLSRAMVLVVVDEGESPIVAGWLPVQTITYTNSFLPRQVLLPRAVGCFRNDTSGQAAYATLRWLTGEPVAGRYPEEDVIRLGRETRTVVLGVQPTITYRSRGEAVVRPVESDAPAKPVPAYGPVGYDTLYLFSFERRGFRDVGYVPCDTLSAGDLARAEKIQLV